MGSPRACRSWSSDAQWMMIHSGTMKLGIRLSGIIPIDGIGVAGTAGHPRGELPQLTGVDVRHEGVAQLLPPPHDHVEAALRGRIDLHGADPRQVARRPREAVGAEDEERDRM